jgi:hypothetical protein
MEKLADARLLPVMYRYGTMFGWPAYSLDPTGAAGPYTPSDQKERSCKEATGY